MVGNYYDEMYRRMGGYHWEDIEKKSIFYTQHTKIIMVLVNKFGKDKVLDVGCGDGYITSLVFKKFKEVIGIDISNEAIKIAKKKNPNIVFEVGSCTTLPFSDESFDTVVASEMIEHVNYNDGKQFLKEAKRVLKPQGKIIISTPNLSNPHMKYLQKTHKNIEHLKEYTKKEFVDLISAYFKIIHLNSGVSLSITIPVIGRFIRIPNCYNYVVGEKIDII